MKLYDHPESGNCHKVRLLLSFLEQSYETETVALLEGEQHENWFQEINPRGEVPVLEDQGHRFWDSQAILVYLARQYDSRDRWLPLDPVSLGQINQWFAVSAAEIQGGVWVARAILAFDWPHPVDLETAQERAEQALTLLENRLAENDWLVGQQATVADIACFPYIAMHEMADLSLEAYPGVEAWLNRFKRLPGYITMEGIPAAD